MWSRPHEFHANKDFWKSDHLNSIDDCPVMILFAFSKVVGLDYCGLMIEAARKLQSGRTIEYGDNQVAQISFGESIDPNRVHFVQVST